MSNRDKNMFRKEQRFSFRKFSFGLASALIASVIFGGSVASGNVAHANSTTEVVASSSEETATASSGEGQATETATTTAAADTPVERTIVLTYIVNLVDQDGTVVKSEEKTVEVTTTAAVAEAKVVLDETLLPEGYKHVAGLEEVTVTEGAQNVFTVSVEKEAAETPAEIPAETPAETTSTTEVQPEVATIVETTETNTYNISTAAIFTYEVNYTTAEGEVVGKTANIVAADSPNATSQEITVSASDIPAGYELAAGQLDKITAQLTANQVNILSFAVVKKSEEEEIAESQLADKTVLEQVVSEADLLADEALRQVAKEQAGNTSLENAAIATKETAKEAQVILNDASATQEVVDATVETVKASTSALADEMLKVDEDGNITAQLSVESSDTVFSNAANTSYIVADSQNLNTAGEHLKVSQAVSGDIQTGQTSTWTVIYNEGNPSTGYGHSLEVGSSHRFGIGNEVVGDINIQTYERSDANGMWVLVDSRTQRDWTSTGGEYYTHKALLADFKQVLDNNGEGQNSELSTLHNIGNGSPNEIYHTFKRSFGKTTRQFKFVVTAKIKAGRNAENVAFLAGNDPGSTRNRYYSATPAKVDPVTISDIAGGQSSVTITPQEIAERIEVKVKDQNVVLERQADGTYNATTNAANVTVATNTATGAYTPTITLTLPTGTTFAEGDKVRAQSSIADASQINNSGLNRSGTKYDQLISSDQGRQYSVITEKTITPATPVVEKTDQYNITWDNQSVTGRSDAGFEWAQDANGNKVLVYKYDLDDRTAFTTNEVLVQLNAEGAGLRTLDGTEKALIENADANDGYTTEGNTAKLNGQTIDFLDIVNPNPLWGGRKVVDSTADTSVNLNNYNTTGNPTPDYSTFYVPDTTNPGEVTHSVQIGGTNGVGNITLTDNARDLYTNQVDRQKLYIRSVAASYQDGTGSAIDNDTDTDTIPVYFVGYRSVTNQAPTVTVNSTEGTQLNSDSTNNQYLFVFGTTEGTTETEAGTPNAAPVVNKANATKTFATMSDPEGTNLTISYDNNAAEPKTETSLGSNLTLGTDGKIEGSFAHTAGGYYTRRVKVTDAANATTISSAFYTYAYTDKEVDTTAVTKNEGVAVTDAEIFSKLGIAVTSTGYPNDGKTLPTIPESEYTRTIVGYKQNGTYTEATRDQLPTTGEYEVKVRTRNVYGQDIYNWVTVKYNEAPDITEVGTDTNTTVYQNGTVDHYIFVFGKTEGTTEATNAAGQTAAGNAPVIDKANATKTVVSVSDPENNNPVTITYDNNAEQPKVETTLGSELTVGTDGKLEGYFDHEAGGFHSRRIVATDSLGAKSTSNPFMTYAYTDKEVDTTPVTKTAIGQAVTNEEIFAKLGIVTSSTRFPNNTAAHDVIPTVPTNEYTREVVGYRAVGGTDVTNATTATLPTSGTYEVKVRTRNIYGQDIYNWVTVEYPANTPTTATDKQTIYVFNNTPIQTVDPTTKEPNGVDKVKVATLTDPQGIQSVTIKNDKDLGYTVDTDGNASGTPQVEKLGYYSSALTITDTVGGTTEVFPQSPTDQRYITHIMDVTVTGEVTKAAGQKPTEAEILAQVNVNTGNSGNIVADPTSMYEKILKPGQQVPTKPGRHEVTVRVITDSNVYKDVVVVVNIPEITENTVPVYPEQTVVPGTPATSTPSFTDKNGQPITAPADATYEIPADFQAPAGYTATINPNTGVVTVTAADGTTEDSISVPVTVTYSDGSTDKTTAVFKLDTDKDGTPNIDDTDDDNDGIPDTQDANPKTATKTTVNVDDASVIAGKEITPIPVTVTTDDTQATVEVTNLPDGLAYNPTTKQIEGTPTGSDIPADKDFVDVVVTTTVTDATGTPVVEKSVITVQRDTDGDGTPDGEDKDDDNDGIPNLQDENPKTATKTTVAVEDATVVAGKEITPIPVVVTTDDTQATVEVTNLPAGLTYDKATGQITGTPTGAEIPAGQDSVDVVVTTTVTDATGTPVVDKAIITIQRDTDKDGQPDVTDTDDDNDGIPDDVEKQNGTDPKTSNT
ncbi:TPA: YPDG domain-containing protein, partial [Streptococcus suis]